MEDKKKLEELLKSIWDSLTDEQKKQAKACKSEAELLELAGKAGIELPDEALDAVAGGVETLQSLIPPAEKNDDTPVATSDPSSAAPQQSTSLSDYFECEPVN